MSMSLTHLCFSRLMFQGDMIGVSSLSDGVCFSIISFSQISA